MAKQISRIIQVFLMVLAGAALIVNQQDVFAARGAAKSQKAGKKGRQAGGAGDVWERVRQGLRIGVISPNYQAADALIAAAASPISLTPKTNTGIVVASTEDTMTLEATQASGSVRLTTVISPKSALKKGSQMAEKSSGAQTINARNSRLFKKDLSPEERYTALGRLKLAPKLKTAAEKPDNKQDLSAYAYPKSIAKSPLIERIRTRLNFHPELGKQIGLGKDDKSASALSKTGNASQQPTLAQRAVSNCADLGRKELIQLAQHGMLPQTYLQTAEQCRQKKSEIYERVNRQIALYSQKMGFVNQSAERARPYLYHIVEALGKYGMPYDLALLPIVESGYQPTALSPMSAAGVWQFIPATGRDFGLEQTADYDARMDITAATQAALRFLSGLKDRYHGDWLLALAAYNCGPGNVDAAIARNQTEGLDTDFWSLSLPAETQDYVPRLLAVAHIFANPGKYGLKLRPVRNEPYFIKIAIDRPFDIERLFNKDFDAVARLAGLSREEFGFLNTAYLKSSVTRTKPFSLLMPISNANRLHQSLAFMAQSEAMPGAKNSPAAVVDDDGQAEPFSAFVTKIAQPLLAINPAEIEPSAVQPRQFVTEPFANNEKSYLTVHYLDKGENLKTVADVHGITEQALREFNKIKRKQTVGLGYRLLIPTRQLAQQNHPSVLFKAKPQNSRG